MGRKVAVLAIALCVVLVALVVGISILSNPDASVVDNRITLLVGVITATAVPSILGLVRLNDVSNHLKSQDEKLDQQTTILDSITNNEEEGNTNG